MKTTLTHAQMLALWRRALGLEATAATATVDQWDSIDVEAQLALRMRQWYLRLLDTGDERLLATSDISGQIVLSRAGEGVYTAALPAACRRLLRLDVTDGSGTSTVVVQPLEGEVPEGATRYRRRRANPWGAAAYIPARAYTRGRRLWVVCGHGAAGADALPAVSAAEAVIDPGDEAYVLDEAALATIPAEADLSTFVWGGAAHIHTTHTYTMNDNNIEKQIVAAAHDAYACWEDLRRRRSRHKRFTYGDQWGDMVRDSNGALVREGDLMAAGGRQPLTNNLIRRLVKTIVGRWRNIAAEGRRYAGQASVADLNSLPELDARMLEEFLISGCAVQRVARECRAASGTAVWVDNVSPRDFFVNAFRDPRGRDIRLVGMLHEMTPVELAARFGSGDAAALASLLRRARAIAGGGDGSIPCGTLSQDRDAGDFMHARPGYCRVLEVWTLDSAAGADGASIGMGWHCRWLLPDGTLLDGYHSPWAHGSHPFAVKFYPLTDGEVHSFVEDVVGQQKYINRLIVLIDKMMGASAKGVLLFPMTQKSPQVTWEEIADRWSRADGVIPVTGRSGLMPTQVCGNGADAGAHKLLSLELKLFEDVSGVSNALLGQSSGGTGGAGLFDAQVRNSTIALADIFETFEAFLADRDSRILGCRAAAGGGDPRPNA